MNAQLKIGLLLNDLSLPKSMADALDVPGVEFTAILYPTPKVRGNLLGRAILKAVTLIERAVCRIRSATVSLDGMPSIAIAPRGKMVLRLSEDDLAKLAGFDLLIRCGVGIWKGDILKTPILSFHHGDNRVNRGGPAAFWETFQRWPQTGYILQRLSEQLDGGEVLRRGWIATRPFYAQNVQAVQAQSALALKDVLEEIVATGRLPEAEPPFAYDGPIYRSPRPWPALRYAFTSAWRLAKRGFRRTKHAKWSLSIIRRPFPEARPQIRSEITPPRGRFWADPFLWRHQDETYCLFEDQPLRNGSNACISALRIGDRVEPLGPVLEEPFHLSFPFLFEYQGRIHMVPETKRQGEVRLYATDNFPTGWRFEKVLLSQPAADTMVFEHEGHWYLLTTLDRAGADPWSELALYIADDPTGEWRPHPRSPLMTNSFGGRNAGMARHDGKLYRFGQKQGFDRYGEGVMIFEIEELSPTAYRETLVDEIAPDFDPTICGVHHMSSAGDLTVIDHLRYVPRWLA